MSFSTEELKSLFKNLIGPTAIIAVVAFLISTFAFNDNSDLEDSDIVDQEDFLEQQADIDKGRIPASIDSNSSNHKTSSIVSPKAEVTRIINNGAESMFSDNYQDSSSSERNVSNPGSSTNNSSYNPTSNYKDIPTTLNTQTPPVDSNPVLGISGGSFVDDEVVEDIEDEVVLEDIHDEKPSYTPIECSVDKLAGVYSGGFSATIRCDVAATINYCLQLGGGCCNAGTSTYSVPVVIGPDDGEYCLSYQATASDGGNSTDAVDLDYIINTTLPKLEIDFSKLFLQTTEAPLITKTQSEDFGKIEHFYSQYNLKAHDPTPSGLNWNCEEILDNYSALVSPDALVIDEHFDTSGLLFDAQIEQNVSISGLDYGNNYVSTVFVDEGRTPASFMCTTQNIILSDFELFSFTGTDSTEVVAGVRKTQGGFTGYSHFESTPSATQSSGLAENSQTNAILETNFFTITN